MKMILTMNRENKYLMGKKKKIRARSFVAIWKFIKQTKFQEMVDDVETFFWMKIIWISNIF